jgi:D-arabinose 1-dehydrogenase-like Zn-dependent alcohol dehydrogenase
MKAAVLHDYDQHLLPGERIVVLGIGGLGHIAVQVLVALLPADIIAVDRSEAALTLAAQCGGHHVVQADEFRRKRSDSSPTARAQKQ